MLFVFGLFVKPKFPLVGGPESRCAFVSRCFVFSSVSECNHVNFRQYRRVIFCFSDCQMLLVLYSKHVCDVGAEPGVTAGGAAARKLPRRGPGENPHPGQPVALARAQGGNPQTRAEGPATGDRSGRGV